MLSTHFYVLSTPFHVLSTPFYVLSTPFYVPSTPFYVLSTPFYVLSTYFYVLSTSFHVLSVQAAHENRGHWFGKTRRSAWESALYLKNPLFKKVPSILPQHYVGVLSEAPWLRTLSLSLPLSLYSSLGSTSGHSVIP